VEGKRHYAKNKLQNDDTHCANFQGDKKVKTETRLPLARREDGRRKSGERGPLSDNCRLGMPSPGEVSQMSRNEVLNRVILETRKRLSRNEVDEMGLDYTRWGCPCPGGKSAAKTDYFMLDGKEREN